jgi:hypothetical protein
MQALRSNVAAIENKSFFVVFFRDLRVFVVNLFLISAGLPSERRAQRLLNGS